MRKITLFLAFVGLVIVVAIGFLSEKNIELTTLMKLQEEYPKSDVKSADHAKFPILQKKFNSPNDITLACLSCHNNSGLEVMHTSHWNWSRDEYIDGKGIVSFGKKNGMNSFCIGVQGSEKSCAKCHIGNGMHLEEFSYDKEEFIDCLICHDQTETYAKANNQGGLPVKSLDFNKIAQSVGKPQRTNCGVCHFYGGGGNNVKHGDLEKSMFYPTKEIDIHMGTDGADMQCVDCHVTENHNIKGKLFSLSSMNLNRVYCEDCHTNSPHEKGILNEHTYKVACQTCHIPVYAKVNSTKTWWDWSTAGKLKDGKPYHEDDSLGNHSYLSIKGSFEWGNNLKPEYLWFNGTATHYLEGDVIEDTSKPYMLNPINGEYREANSKIIPVKVMKTNQPFDPINKILIQPYLYSDNKGDGAYWKDFDWQTASAEGMKKAGLPFSGKVTFINTEMNWPLNHMVSSKENSLKCNDCHTRDNGRLASLTDFYMPGRDRSELVDFIGTVAIILSLIGVLSHGLLRIYFARIKKVRG